MSQGVAVDEAVVSEATPEVAEASRAANVKYQITVRTSDRAHADTAARVFIVLHGNGVGEDATTDGRVLELPKATGAVPLVTPLDEHKRPFRRGAESVFVIDAPDVGTVIGCRVGHSGGVPGRGGDWCCASVAVTETRAGETAAFPCNKWISPTNKDGAEDIAVEGGGGDPAARVTFHFRSLGECVGSDGKVGGAFGVPRQPWGHLAKDEYGGALSAKEIEGQASEIKALQRKPSKAAPAFTGGVWSGPRAAQKAAREKAEQKSREVLKEREVISGWLRNGEPGGIAGLAKELVMDEARALRRVDGYATTGRFHIYRDPNRPQGGVAVDVVDAGAGKKAGSGGNAASLGSSVASKLTASTRPPSNQSIAAAAGRGPTGGAPAGMALKQDSRGSALIA